MIDAQMAAHEESAEEDRVVFEHNKRVQARMIDYKLERLEESAEEDRKDFEA